MQSRAGYICFMEWQFSLKEIAAVSVQFWQAAGNKRVFALHGSMGAGKTTLVHALCDALKVSSPVGSPTFSLINE
jgi:tRNA threonylcarbamoyladenosine biosynthesis protein TsaE